MILCLCQATRYHAADELLATMTCQIAGRSNVVNRLGPFSRESRNICVTYQSRHIGQSKQHCATTATAQHMTADQQQTKMVLVVAVALIDNQQRVLLAQRPEGKAMAGLWEFPGGKVMCSAMQQTPAVLHRCSFS